MPCSPINCAAQLGRPPHRKRGVVNPVGSPPAARHLPAGHAVRQLTRPRPGPASRQTRSGLAASTSLDDEGERTAGRRAGKRGGIEAHSPRWPCRTSSGWLQSWLQLTAFATVRRSSRSFMPARQTAHGTAANRQERDHDDLAVWESGDFDTCTGDAAFDTAHVAALTGDDVSRDDQRQPFSSARRGHAELAGRQRSSRCPPRP